MSSDPLTEKQKQTVIDTIRNRAPEMECPTCGDVRWSLQERLHVMPAIDATGTVDPSMGFPAIVLTCKSCFHVQVFNAVQMGVADKP